MIRYIISLVTLRRHTTNNANSLIKTSYVVINFVMVSPIMVTYVISPFLTVKDKDESSLRIFMAITIMTLMTGHVTKMMKEYVMPRNDQEDKTQPPER